jgi:hypothetical protein
MEAEMHKGVKVGEYTSIRVKRELWLRLVKLKYELGVRNVGDVIELVLQRSGLESGAPQRSGRNAEFQKSGEAEKERSIEAEKQRSRETEMQQSVEAEKEQAAKEGSRAEPTPKQLALIESLLRQLGDDWGTVREILLLDKGIETPEDYRQLSGETLDRVIKALKEWAKHPAAGEIKDARLRAQKLFEQGVNVGLPESTRDVLRYHLVKLELAEAGALKPKK